MGVLGPIQLVGRRRGEYPLVQDTVKQECFSVVEPEQINEAAVSQKDLLTCPKKDHIQQKEVLGTIMENAEHNCSSTLR